MFIDRERVKAVAEIVAKLPEEEHGLNFYSFTVKGREIPAADMYPSIAHPSAVDFFFFVGLHQYGFWLSDEGGYVKPLVGQLGGKPAKGSDLLWKMCMRALVADPNVFEAARLADADDGFCERLFTDDDGPVPFPNMKERLELIRAYGRSMRMAGWTPSEVVQQANAAAHPLQRFVGQVCLLGGYNGDPIAKKAILLAMTLAMRPERFLRVPETTRWPPIVDYHLMRVALRTGMVVLKGEQAILNAARVWVPADVEAEIRQLTYEAVSLVIEQSGRTMQTVDHAFWSARRFCPEMEMPKCETCVFAAGCAKKVELFQPVFRTTNY